MTARRGEARRASSGGRLEAGAHGGRLSARDITRILGAGLRAGGTDISDEEVARERFGGGVPEMARLAARLLRATFLDDADETRGEQEGPSGARA